MIGSSDRLFNSHVFADSMVSQIELRMMSAMVTSQEDYTELLGGESEVPITLSTAIGTAETARRRSGAAGARRQARMPIASERAELGEIS